MYKMVPTSDIKSFNTLNAMFMALSHAWLTLYSTGEKHGWQKTENLPQRFCLLQNGKPIVKLLVFQCLHLKFSLLLPLIWIETGILKIVPALSWKWNFARGSPTELPFFSFGKHIYQLNPIKQWNFSLSECCHWISFPLDYLGFD